MGRPREGTARQQRRASRAASRRRLGHLGTLARARHHDHDRSRARQRTDASQTSYTPRSHPHSSPVMPGRRIAKVAGIPRHEPALAATRGNHQCPPRRCPPRDGQTLPFYPDPRPIEHNDHAAATSIATASTSLPPTSPAPDLRPSAPMDATADRMVRVVTSRRGPRLPDKVSCVHGRRASLVRADSTRGHARSPAGACGATSRIGKLRRGVDSVSGLVSAGMPRPSSR
jgi:hypothetical protein